MTDRGADNRSAQQRPGLKSRRQLRGVMASWPLKARSTKAEFQPGDITCPCGPTQYQNASGLDEGRGLIPGDTPPCPERYEFADALNEGRGVDPRRHSFPWAGPAGMTATLNEGRGLIPGDTSNAFLLLVRGSALNEGRGLIPGDTTRSCRPSL